MKKRNSREILNIITSFICQIVTTACGIVIPRIMIGAFGSAVYGATTSISQFLSYIALLEGGIGRVARGAMYQPLVKHDEQGVSRVYHATKRFFLYVGVAFLGYTLIISLSYRQIADVSFLSWESVFLLVWAISLSTLFKYMGGLADLTLLNADQKQYYTNSVTVFTNLLNTAAIVFLTYKSQSVVSVKLTSSLIFILRPIFFRAFVKKNYTLPAVKNEQTVLQNKWTGIGQHIAYFLHTNTDVVILTLFADLPTVSVYAVYSLIIVNIRNITASLSGGMEAAFGALIAKKETSALHNAYRRYKLLLSSAVIVLFGVTSVLLIPFVQLYTTGITDADYSQSLFAILLLVAEAIHCLTLPCSTLPISANMLKSSRRGAYGEAIINISLSCLLVLWNPLLGVAIGTLASECFKGLYYMIYSAKHILKIKKTPMIGEFCLSILMLISFCFGGNAVLSNFEIQNYWQWCGWGIVFFMCACGITLAIDALLFPKELRRYLSALLKRKKNHKRLEVYIVEKILIINNNLHIGGVQKALINLLNCIHDQYDITLALFYPEGELLREIPGDVKILPIRSAYRFLGMTKQDVDGKPLQKIQRGFYAAICRLLGRNMAISFMALRQRKIAGFDVVISYLHDGTDRMFYGGCNDFVLRHTVAGKKITFLHCDYEKCGANTAANAARYKQFDIIAACSDGCRSAFVTAVPELKKKCITVRNCQNYEEICAAAEKQPVEFPNDRINIVTVARLGREKGVGRAVEAFNRLKDLSNRFHYYILGDGIERSDIEEKIKQMGLNDQITLLGESANPYGYMKAADLLLIPSVSEAAPMVIGEAASLGTPVLSTETSSAREMIEAYDYGWVCENSVEGMIESLSMLLNNTEAIIATQKTLEQMKFGNDEALAQFAELFV